METREPSKPKKARGTYDAWTSQESKMLINLLVKGIRRGWRDSNGSISKTTVETKILSVLNKELKCNKNYKNYLSRMKSLKKEYHVYAELFRCSSGFGWDPLTKQFTAPDEVWDEYIKGHPNHTYLRDNTIEDFEDLQTIFESVIARGNNAFGLGSDTNAQTFESENDVQPRDDVNHMENVDEGYEATFESPKEKLPPKKKAKTNGAGDPSESANHGVSEKVLTEMIGVSTNIISLLQQREERHQRETELRGTHEKKNSVWDAIKEIPELEDHIRYDAVTKIHTLKMKDVFVSMSIEERLSWIRHNIC